ncbi:hypothetical protein TSOC_014850, partial [Tetrabaena socialis]
ARTATSRTGATATTAPSSTCRAWATPCCSGASSPTARSTRTRCTAAAPSSAARSGWPPSGSARGGRRAT